MLGLDGPGEVVVLPFEMQLRIAQEAGYLGGPSCFLCGRRQEGAWR